MKFFRDTIKLTIATMLLIASSTAAADASMMDALDSELAVAKEIYEQRGSKDQTEALRIIDHVIANSQGDLQYEAYLLGAKSSWWQAEAHVQTKKNKLIVFQKGVDYATHAIALKPEISSGYLWRAFNLGQFSLVKGVVKSLLLGLGKKIEADLKTAMAKKTADGKPGESDDIYGPVRALGKFYFTLAVFPGSKNYDKGLALLKKAYDQKSTQKVHPLNFVFYAEALAKKNKTREQAKQILNEVLSLSKDQFDELIFGELDYDLMLAENLLKSLK